MSAVIPTPALTPSPKAGGFSTISWMTLFYDLIIVAVFARATYIYGKNPSWFTFVFIVVALLSLYALWSLTTLELVMSPHQTWMRRVVVLVQVVALLVAGLAMYRGGGISDRWGFIGLSVGFFTTAILTWLRVREPGSDRRWLTSLLTVSLGAAAIFGVGALFPMGYLVGDVLIAWIFYPVATAWAVIGLLIVAPRYLVAPSRVDSHSLNERFGVLLLIVLGDAFLQLLEVLGALRSIPAPEFLVLTLLLVVSIWLMYFPILAEPQLATSILRARSRVAAHFLLVLSSAFGIVAYVELSTGFSNNDAEGETTAWSTSPVLAIAVAILWLTWLQMQKWTRVVTVHVVAVAILLVLTIVSQATGEAGREIDLIVANLVLLADAVIVVVLHRRSEKADANISANH